MGIILWKGNPVTTKPEEKKAFPPRCKISFFVDGKSTHGGCSIYEPQYNTTMAQYPEYLSVEESDAITKEAVAKAYSELSKIFNTEADRIKNLSPLNLPALAQARGAAMLCEEKAAKAREGKL